MAKSKSQGLAASSKHVDPALAALFSESAGPVIPPRTRYSNQRTKEASQLSDDEVEEESEEIGSADAGDESEEISGDESEAVDDTSAVEGPSADTPSKEKPSRTAEAVEELVKHGAGSTHDKRKRRRQQKREDEELESRYLKRLEEDEEEPAAKRPKNEDEAQENAGDKDGNDDDDADDDDDSADENVPVHESLAADSSVVELDKANRTIFLSNVSTEAITSRQAKKTLLTHLSSILDKSATPQQTVESIRFRSTAYATAAIPKRAAFAQKSVMDATTKSTNAYAVYSTASAVRTAITKLNGTVVLDRHLRVDSVAHPAAVDHKRCVFVGNLGFVDDESVLNTKVDDDGKEVTEKRKRTKTPMDVEEGLWRVFGKKAGKVESVRVVRDAATRVGKGFAYVQFYDPNAVESALTLSGSKFPPMLPRELRVSRCKAPQKTARALEAKRNKNRAAAVATAGSGSGSGGNDKNKRNNGTEYIPKPTAEAQTLAGRAGKLLGRAAAAQLGGNSSSSARRNNSSNNSQRGNHNNGRKPFLSQHRNGAGHVGNFKSPEDIVFEGRRASAKDGKPRDLKFKGSKSSSSGGRVQKKRMQARAAKWKAGQKGGGAK